MTSPVEAFVNSVNSLISKIHTSIPAIIVSYDPSTNKAVVQPALNKKYTSGEKPLPQIHNVPIVFPGSSNYRMTFPINEGDYVLLLFSERSIDLWLSVGGQVTPDDPRKYDLSDAIAIPGLLPFNSDFSGNNGIDFVVSFGGSSITIKPDGTIVIDTANKVSIGNSSAELLKILYDLMGLLQGAAVMGPAFNGPLSLDFIADVLALQIQLDLIKVP